VYDVKGDSRIVKSPGQVGDSERGWSMG